MANSKSKNNSKKNNVSNISTAASVAQIISTIFGLLLGGSILYTPIPLFGKIAILLTCYLTSFYFWYKFKTSRSLLKYIIIIFTVFVLSWIGYSIFNYHNEGIAYQRLLLRDKTKNPIFTSSLKKFRILILPFETYRFGNKVDIGNLVFDRLQELNEDEKLNCQINYWSDFKGKILTDSLIYWKNFHHADLIISGKFLEENSGKSYIQFKYVANDNTYLKELSKKTDDEFIPISLVQLAQGELQGDVDFIIEFTNAYIELRQSQYNTALSRFLKIANKFNPDVIDYFIGSCYQYLGQIPKAIFYQQKSIKNNPYFYEPHADLARAYLLNKEYEKAKNEYIICNQISPTESHGWFGLGFSYRCLNNFQDAIIAYTTAISIKPSKIYYLNRGVAYFLSKDIEASINDFNQVIEIDPNYAKAYVNLGLSEASVGKYESAILDYNKAIEIDATLAEAYFCRGNIKIIYKDFYSAIEDYTIAIEYSPKEARYYFNRGIIYQKVANPKEAISDFSKVIFFEPKNAKAFFYRAKSKAAIKDMKGYNADLLTAKRLDPTLKNPIMKFKGQEFIITN